MSMPEYRLKTRLSRIQMLALGAALTAAGFACSTDEQTVAVYGAPIDFAGGQGGAAGTGGTAAGTGGTAAAAGGGGTKGHGGTAGSGDSGGDGGGSGEGGGSP
jgi:hypothetical protein